ncbi:MAG: tyrosine-type recombinase/integrase [Bacteroidetes bacterium]|nr:tyrosine-type recombinase/integrase [Bacteroidota bacterium]
MISGSLAFNVQKSWMLSFYCAGIRAEDLLTLKVKNIVLGRLVYQMNKTGKLKSIKVTPKIQTILDNFISKKSKPNDYIFPFMPDYADQLEPHGKEFKCIISSRTAQMNKHLKDIATKAKIEKKITNHIARHSFANVARKKTNDIHAIKSALGHSSTKITELYLDSFDEEGLDSMMETVAG